MFSFRRSFAGDVVSGTLAALIFCSCSSRQSFVAGEIPRPQPITEKEQQKGAQIAAYLISHFQPVTDKAQTKRLANIFGRLVLTSSLNSEKWYLTSFKQDAIVNAASTSGNHLFVWSGLLNFAKTDGELAAVIAHEVGHVLARHATADSLETATNKFAGFTARIGSAASSYRPYSYSYGNNAGAASLGSAAVALTSFIISATVQKALIEPESQRKEYEADTIGLFVMAEAGYDPREAIAFWKRSAESEQAKGASSLALYHSHPSSLKRVKHLEELLAEAMIRYEASPARQRAAATSQLCSVNS